MLLTFLTLVVFEKLHALKGGCTCNKLVGEVRLVLWLIVASIVVVHLLVGVLSIVCVIRKLVYP